MTKTRQHITPEQPSFVLEDGQIKKKMPKSKENVTFKRANAFLGLYKEVIKYDNIAQNTTLNPKSSYRILIKL